MQKRVLLIEDEPGALGALRERLGAANVQVMDSFGCLQGLERFDSFQPDLVVMELGAPLGGGLADLDRMQSVCSQDSTPVVYMTSHDSKEYRVRTRDQSVAGFFEGPLKLDYVMMVIQMGLAKAKGLASLG